MIDVEKMVDGRERERALQGHRCVKDNEDGDAARERCEGVQTKSIQYQ